MRVLRSPLVPRVLLGIMSFLMVLLAVSSIQALSAGGLSANSVFMLLFAVALAVLSCLAALGLVDVGIESS